MSLAMKVQMHTDKKKTVVGEECWEREIKESLAKNTEC